MYSNLIPISKLFGKRGPCPFGWEFDWPVEKKIEGGRVKTKPIYCCGCATDVNANLKSGKDIYPHRADLHSLPFWMCPTCKNFVGCHHKTRNRTAPLGCIPTTELKNARRHLHALIDPLGGQAEGKVRGTAVARAIVTDRFEPTRRPTRSFSCPPHQPFS